MLGGAWVRSRCGGRSVWTSRAGAAGARCRWWRSRRQDRSAGTARGPTSDVVVPARARGQGCRDGAAGSRSAAAQAAVSSRRVPTLFATNALGKRLASSCIPRQPVQWAGTTTVRRQLTERLHRRPDHRLEQRAGEVEPTEHRVHPVHPGQRPRMPHDVDHAGMPAPGDDDEPAAGHVHDQRLVVEDQRVRLPAPVPQRLVDREALLEVGRTRHLAGDQHAAGEQERRLRPLDDVEADALQRAAAGGRQLPRLAAGQRDPPARPELRGASAPAGSRSRRAPGSARPGRWCGRSDRASRPPPRACPGPAPSGACSRPSRPG